MTTTEEPIGLMKDVVQRIRRGGGSLDACRSAGHDLARHMGGWEEATCLLGRYAAQGDDRFEELYKHCAQQPSYFRVRSAVRQIGANGTRSYAFDAVPIGHESDPPRPVMVPSQEMAGTVPGIRECVLVGEGNVYLAPAQEPLMAPSREYDVVDVDLEPGIDGLALVRVAAEGGSGSHQHQQRLGYGLHP